MDRADFVKNKTKLVGLPYKMEAEKFLESTADAVVITRCPNRSHPFCQIFVGPDSPVIETIWTDTPSLSNDSPLEVRFGMNIYSQNSQYISISTSVTDPAFHHKMLTHRDVQLMNNAFGARSQHPDRKTCVSRGHCTFQGYKETGSASNPTPSEGPNMQARY